MKLRAIVANSAFRLSHVAGPADADLEVSGAHASEQLDPTPFLNGGEFLMLDGLILPEDDAGLRSYVERLKARGVVAIGFGISDRTPFHTSVPAALLRQADDAGFPIYAIPDTTPFIAITQFVYTQMADEKFSVTRQIVRGQRRLAAAAARRDTINQLLSTLKELAHIDGAVFDLQGRPLSDDPPARLQQVAAANFAPEEQQLHRSSRVIEPGSDFELQPLGTERVRGAVVYDVTAADASSGSLGRELTAFATSLLSIELERRHVLRMVERRPAAEAVERLMAGLPPQRAAQLVASLGIRTDALQAVCVRPQNAQVLVDSLSDQLPEALIHESSDGGELVIAVPADSERIQHRLGELLAGEVSGMGGAVFPHNFPATVRQARRAARISADSGGGLVQAMGLGSVQMLLQLGTRESISAFADGVLRPLDLAPNGDGLLISLRAYLEADGFSDRAAAVAHIHRHTMRNHLRRVEEITHRSLTSTQDRAELWLAFEARDLSDIL